MEDELKEKGLEAGGIFLEKGGRPERRQMKGEWIYKLFGCITGRPETGWLGMEREGPGIIPGFSTALTEGTWERSRCRAGWKTSSVENMSVPLGHQVAVVQKSAGVLPLELCREMGLEGCT